eukprot:scaffold5915_cov128-Isochrysis_galbana.AAC.1
MDGRMGHMADCTAACACVGLRLVLRAHRAPALLGCLLLRAGFYCAACEKKPFLAFLATGQHESSTSACDDPLMNWDR